VASRREPDQEGVRGRRLLTWRHCTASTVAPTAEIPPPSTSHGMAPGPRETAATSSSSPASGELAGALSGDDGRPVSVGPLGACGPDGATGDPAVSGEETSSDPDGAGAWTLPGGGGVDGLPGSAPSVGRGVAPEVAPGRPDGAGDGAVVGGGAGVGGAGVLPGGGTGVGAGVGVGGMGVGGGSGPVTTIGDGWAIGAGCGLGPEADSAPKVTVHVPAGRVVAPW
jgi:hypothetical protein